MIHAPSLVVGIVQPSPKLEDEAMFLEGTDFCGTFRALDESRHHEAHEFKILK